MPVFNQYYYEPLETKDVLRLVALDPATDERDPLSCTIFQCRRSAQRQEYSAISNTWDEQTPSQTLEIRCDDDISYVRITANVDALLRDFRAREKPCYLWVDAICLDQTNGEEKSQQIPLMGRIYGEAKDVRIWLGPDDRVTAKVFTLLRLLSQVLDVQPQWHMAERVVFHLNEVFCRKDGVVGLKSLLNFFSRSWFSRRWVVQEAMLAREAIVHCGRYSIALLSISLAATRFLSLDVASYPVNMAASLREPTTKRGILELLWYFHEAECRDPKDRIAALLGLVPNEKRFPLDYTAHWTELYRQVASLAFGLNDRAINFQLLRVSAPCPIQEMPSIRRGSLTGQSLGNGPYLSFLTYETQTPTSGILPHLNGGNIRFSPLTEASHGSIGIPQSAGNGVTESPT
ncbi:HET domain-containing protein [Colletotrichum asianum]|uniref:HET domain-containing protein n=1 Tax=Colletotrichum asianum TaxID=702518 RepID=A0A8H3ZMC2_9PEZI|nr:HET domain-containing protein [Colletotrichum asianum]